jgi:hypothetical protein
MDSQGLALVKAFYELQGQVFNRSGQGLVHGEGVEAFLKIDVGQRLAVLDVVQDRSDSVHSSAIRTASALMSTSRRSFFTRIRILLDRISRLTTRFRRSRISWSILQGGSDGPSSCGPYSRSSYQSLENRLACPGQSLSLSQREISSLSAGGSTHFRRILDLATGSWDCAGSIYEDSLGMS